MKKFLISSLLILTSNTVFAANNIAEVNSYKISTKMTTIENGKKKTVFTSDQFVKPGENIKPIVHKENDKNKKQLKIVSTLNSDLVLDIAIEKTEFSTQQNGKDGKMNLSNYNKFEFKDEMRLGKDRKKEVYKFKDGKQEYTLYISAEVLKDDDATVGMADK